MHLASCFNDDLEGRFGNVVHTCMSVNPDAKRQHLCVCTQVPGDWLSCNQQCIPPALNMLSTTESVLQP